MNTEANNTQAAINAGKQLLAPQEITVGKTPFLVTHKDANVKSLEENLDNPLHLKEKLNLHDAKSFIEYFNNFANEDSHIFVNMDHAKFKAIIDYHSDTETPHHGHHTLEYTCPKTPEWSKWLRFDGEKMDQTDFALFIEDNLQEIVTPDGAVMLEIAASLQSKNNASFSSATRLDNGETQFAYKEDIESSAGVNGQLAIPSKIELALQPFQGSDTYKVEARFRYRIRNGALTMWYDIIRPHKILEDAVQDTFKAINEGKTKGHILMGDCPK